MEENHQTCVFLALGSNLGNRCENLHQAVEKLSEKITIAKTSSIYETPPWGYEEQPLFYNQVISGYTSLSPSELLVFAKNIELEMGRVKNFRNGPRLIDIDILIFGDQIMNTDSLIIPHPRMVERAFVMVPLVEIDPDLLIPGIKNSAVEVLQNLDQKNIHKLNPEKVT